MYFILNKGIRFTPATNELSLIPDAKNSILISNAASRLLLELVRNANEISSRDDLLQKVWDDYGYKSSYNNLYMAVSEIRKTLERLDYNKAVIVTVPKIGIKLVAEIDVFELSKGAANTASSVESPGVAPVIFSSEESHSIMNKEKSSEFENNLGAGIIKQRTDDKNNFFRWLLPLLIVVLSTTFFYHQYNKKLTFSPLVQYDIFDFHSCHVYIINSSVGYNINLLKDRAIKLLSDNHVDCSSEEKSVYFQDNFIRSEKFNEYTIGVCSRSSGKNKCETIKSLAG